MEKEKKGKVVVPEAFTRAFEDAITKYPIIRLKPLPQILAEMEENICRAEELARRAGEAARTAREASIEGANAAMKAGELAAAAAKEAAMKAAKGAQEAIHAARETAEAFSKSIGKELSENKQIISNLEKRLAKLEAENEKHRTIVLREMSRDQAKQEIEELFASGQTLYYSDIAEKVRLDIEQVVEICKELIKERKIEVAKSA